jgi:hypothetical protein
MRTPHPSATIGVFSDPDEASRAVHELLEAGFRETQVGLVAPSDEGPGRVQHRLNGSGETLGIATGVVPLVGPAVAAGTLKATLLNGTGHPAAPGLFGALVDWGFPEADAQHYERTLRSGRPLVTVHANGRSGEAWAILRRHGAQDRLPTR